MSDEDEFNPWMDALLATTKQLEQMRAERDAAIRERDEARHERDEARRQLCYWWELSKRQRKTKNGHKFTPTHVQWAQIGGWDCFKEDA